MSKLMLNNIALDGSNVIVRKTGGGGGITVETDPIFTASPAAGITGNDISKWNGKQDSIGDLSAIREGAALGETALQPASIANMLNKMAIVSANGTTLSPSVNTYYNFASVVNTLAVTLPSVTDATHINNIVFMFTTGSAPSVTFAAPNGINIIAQDGFRIDASTTYEINAIFNGVAWIIASIKLNQTV